MIDRRSFLNLRPGVDQIIDAKGRVYRVISANSQGSHPVVPGPKEIVLEDIGGEQVTLGWDEESGKIVNKEFCPIEELNNDEAIIVVS